MKKLYFLIFIVFIFSGLTTVKSQNLVQNPGLENWTTDTEPTGYLLFDGISKESTTIHGGTFSAKHTSASSTRKLQQVVEGITPGSTYTISYYFYDNTDAAKMRPWCYWLNGTATLDADAEVLRPGTYSTNSSQWQMFSAVITAPAGATSFRFELRVYNQDGANGEAVYYDDLVFSGDVQVTPEPTNYPTAFAAAAQGAGINLTWVDAVGAQLPEGYLIYGETAAAQFTPVDGTPVMNNLDISMGYVAMNVPFGDENFKFTMLQSTGAVNFRIFPYTNTGVNIDYKTDGTAPAASATPANISILLSETFDADLGVMTANSVIGDQTWIYYNFGGEDFARVSGYQGGNFDNEDWLISPVLNCTNMAAITMNFRTAKNYAGADLKLMVSSNYTGTGNPNTATWTDITSMASWSAGSWAWANSGDVLLSSYASPTMYIAFKYTSTATEGATYQVDDILIYGISTIGLNENASAKLNVYPNPTNDFVHFVTNNTATVSVSDLTGRMLIKETLGAGQQQLHVGALPSGLYLMVVEENGQKSIARISVK